MDRELKGFKITVTYANGFVEVFHHLFARCESVTVAMDRYVSAITFLEKQGEVATEQIWG